MSANPLPHSTNADTERLIRMALAVLTVTPRQSVAANVQTMLMVPVSPS
jgi:hypothetical protein